jgi:L-amino acid N-acyltransferase YncA
MPDALLDGLSVDDRHRVWTQNLSAAQSQTLVVESEVEIIVWASIGPCRDAETQGLAEVYGIYLDPAHYRKGFGKSIWSEAVRRLNAMGYHELVVWVLSENAPARRFYEAMGGTLDAGVEKVFTREGARLLEVRYRFRCE